MYIFVSQCINTYTHTYIHTHTFVQISHMTHLCVVCMFMFTLSTHSGMYVCFLFSRIKSAHLCLCVFSSMYVCSCCTNSRKMIEADTDMERPATDINDWLIRTGRQADRKTGRH